MVVNTADPRVRRTRRLLQQALEALLHEKGFQELSVQDIAERATVNRATFYAHFTDKYDLLDSLMREGFQERLATRFPVTSAVTLPNLHLLIGTVFDYLAEMPPGNDCPRPSHQQLLPLFQAAVQQTLYEYILRWLGQEGRGDTPRRALLETTALVMSWAIFGAGIEGMQHQGARAADELTGQLVTILTHGIGGTGSGLAAGPQVPTRV